MMPIRTRLVSTARTSLLVRNFSRTTPAFKGPVESVKDGLKTVDKTVADAAVKGIEKGEEATAKAKEATGMGKGKAAELAGEAKGKAKEVAGEAKGKAAEVKNKI